MQNGNRRRHWCDVDTIKQESIKQLNALSLRTLSDILYNGNRNEISALQSMGGSIMQRINNTEQCIIFLSPIDKKFYINTIILIPLMQRINKTEQCIIFLSPIDKKSYINTIILIPLT